VKELLLIGAGYMGSSYLAAARRLGVRLTLVETELHQARLEGEVDRFILAAGSSEEDWAAAAFAAADACEPDGVLGFAELQVVAAALVQDPLDMPGPSLHAAVISRNKALQRGCFANAGLRQPEYLLARDVESAVLWAKKRLPVVVKPLTGSGSAGVVQVTDLADLAEILRARMQHERVLVEECATGEEYSWEGLVREGKIIFGNITAKETTGPPEFVEVAHRAGHRLAEPDRFAVDGLAHAVVAALRMRTGIVHLEFRLTPEGPAIIEVAVRTPGDYIMDVMALTYDFDPYELLISMAVDLPVAVPAPSRPAAYGASWFPRAPAGRVARIDGVEALAAHRHVTEVKLRISPGHVVAPLLSSAQRVGHVLFRAPTPDALEDAMAEARRTLAIDVQPDG
jgi:biotin carboxylase